MIALVPLVIFFSLRLIIVPANPEFSYISHARYFSRISLIHWRRVGHSFLNIYGLIPVILLLHLTGVIRFLKKNLHLTAYLICTIPFVIGGGVDRCRIAFTTFPAVLICLTEVLKNHREIYRRWIVSGYLIASQLFLMRVYAPMTTANYRRIWWSNISFCPEEIFRDSLIRYLIIAAAFLLVYAGVRLLPEAGNGKDVGSKPPGS